jgi:hypothetical protein
MTQNFNVSLATANIPQQICEPGKRMRGIQVMEATLGARFFVQIGKADPIGPFYGQGPGVYVPIELPLNGIREEVAAGAWIISPLASPGSSVQGFVDFDPVGQN